MTTKGAGIAVRSVARSDARLAPLDSRRGSRQAIPKGDQTRQSIIRVARSYFAAAGFERTTLSDIASSAGVTPPAVIFHFGSKDGLLAAVIADHFDRLLLKVGEIIESDRPSLSRLRAFARFWLGENPAHFDLYSVFASQSGWQLPDSASGLALRDGTRRVSRIFERLVGDLKTDRVFRRDIPTALLRDVFFGTAEHLFRGQMRSHKELDSDRLSEQLLDFYLYGAAAASTGAGGAEVDEETSVGQRLTRVEEELERLRIFPPPATARRTRK